MRIETNGTCRHVTYCLNIHPGETWAENQAALEGPVQALRERIAPDRPFGLGLRLGAQAAKTLMQPEHLAAFRSWLAEHGYYVFTVNAFPYGRFHGAPVKEDVYRPDWRREERLAYTLDVAEILAALLPEGVYGSVSTLPGSYRAWCEHQNDRDRILVNLTRAASALAELEKRTGRCVQLAIEPEPDCLWDTAPQMVRLHTGDLPERGVSLTAAVQGVPEGRLRAAVRRHLGVCFDTCHHAALFEDPATGIRQLVEHGVPVPKVQVSAAPEAACNTPETRRQLAHLADAFYLHQTAVREPDGTVRRYADLGEALSAAETLPESCTIRSHAHIPLGIDRWGALRSTRYELDPAFFRALACSSCSHLELETYTFSVLPESMRRGGVVDSLAGEFEWVLPRMRQYL